MKFQNIFFLLLIITFMTACEDVIDVQLADGDNQLVVDAWINDKPEPQTIKLRRASPYFDSSPSPSVTGAVVNVTDEDGNVFNFEDANNDGNYIWTPTTGNSFGEVGKTYTLSISTDGKEYTAVSSMNPIMPIDSITYEDREEELGQPAGIYAEVFARDLPGFGNAYWIKTFKNGLFLNKPSEMNLAFDAGFTAGAGIDGVYLISPIRQAVNRVPDSGDGATDNSDLPPWKVGDSIHIEIHSLNVDAFYFLEESLTQMTLGDAGIFAEPPSNVPTNIISINGTEPSDNPVGFFNVSAVSADGLRF